MTSAQESDPAIAHMVLARILVRFGEYLEVREQVHLGLELERAVLGPPAVRVTRTSHVTPVIPPEGRRGVIQGDDGLVRELARAVEAMRRRSP